MTATQDLTETYAGAPITAAAVLSGVGMKWGLYSVTKVTQSDWVIFGDLTTVYFAQACFKGADGNTSVESCNITTATPNYVYLGGAATGVEYILVIGA
jgi:hypothetical protein